MHILRFSAVFQVASLPAVAGDDEDMPLAVFLTAEAAYQAWKRSGEGARVRAWRREEALQRLKGR